MRLTTEWRRSVAAVAAAALAGAALTATVDGKLYAATNNTNVQLLWYLDNLVPKPPTTWAGLMSTAAALAKAGKPHYVEVTGAQYEGLVVWFNSMVASAGGTILNQAGTEVTLGPPAERGLTVMRDFAHSKAADPSLSNTQEDPARLAVEGGTAAMELNWPNVYASMATDKPAMLKHFRWAPFPGIDGPGRATIGGENYAVSSYSDHPALESRPQPPADVIIGIRPERFEDARLVSPDGNGVTFTGTVDLLESMGSEKFAYFTLDSGGVESEHLAEIARDSGTEELGGGTQLVAALDPRSTASRGHPLELSFDAAAVHLFEPASGDNLAETPVAAGAAGT